MYLESNMCIGPRANIERIKSRGIFSFFHTIRPFSSFKKSHFQSEAKCEAIDMKMIFNYYANISHFYNKGFALSLVLKVRFFGTRKWPIALLVKVLLNMVNETKQG